MNTPGGWGDTCANLVLLNNIIYDAPKAADPNAIVRAPNMGFSQTTTACSESPTTGGTAHEWIWLQNFLQTRDRNGNLAKVDTVGEHEFQVVQPALHTVARRFLDVYNDFRSVMTAAGIPVSRPLIVSEGSFGPDANPSDHKPTSSLDSSHIASNC